MKLRKVLSLILAIAMMLTTVTIMPLTASAAMAPSDYIASAVISVVSDNPTGTIVKVKPASGHTPNTGEKAVIKFLIVSKADVDDAELGFQINQEILTSQTESDFEGNIGSHFSGALNGNVIFGFKEVPYVSDEAEPTEINALYSRNFSQMYEGSSDSPPAVLPEGDLTTEYVLYVWSMNPTIISDSLTTSIVEIDSSGAPVLNLTDTHIDLDVTSMAKTYDGSPATVPTAVVYEGATHGAGGEVEVSGASVTFEYSTNETATSDVPTDAGQYTVKATYAGDGVTYAGSEASASFEISKAAATLDGAAITVSDTYTKGMTLADLDAKLQAALEAANVKGSWDWQTDTTEVGVETTSAAIVSVDSTNYTTGVTGSVTLSISKADTDAQTPLSNSELFSGAALPDLSSLVAVESGTSNTVSGSWAWGNKKSGDAVISNGKITGTAGQTAEMEYTFTPSGDDAKNYEAVTKTVTLTVKAAGSTSIALSASSDTYSGSDLTPTVTVKDSLDQPIDGSKYTLTWSSTVSGYNDNDPIINAGTYTATVTMNDTGEYADPTPVTFTVNKATATAEITAGGTVTYNGAEQKPTVKVTLSGSELTSPADYSVQYLQSSASVTPKNAGSYDVQVTLSADIAKNAQFDGGAASKTFSNGLVINKAAATLALANPSAALTYTGEAQTPAVKLTWGADNSQTVNSNYYETPVYSNNTNAGTATVTVALNTTAGEGANFSLASGSLNFNIGKATLDLSGAANPSGAEAISKTYDGLTTGGTKTIEVTGQKSEAVKVDIPYTYSSADAGDAVSLTIGDPAFSASQAGGILSGNYQLSNKPTNWTGKISKAVLTWAYPSPAQEVIEKVETAITAPTLQDINHADVSSAWYNLSYSTSESNVTVNNGKISSTTTGDKTIHVTAAATVQISGNYAMPAQGSFTIKVNPAAANTMKVNDQSGTAQGNDFGINLQYGDSFTVVTTDVNGGAPSVSVNGSGLAIDGTNTAKVNATGYNGSPTISVISAAANGAAEKTITITVTLSPKKVTLAQGTAAAVTKDYDGTTAATGFEAAKLAVSGAVTGDTADDIKVASGTAGFENANAGDNKTIKVTNVSLDGNKSAYYTLGSDNHIDITGGKINAKELAWPAAPSNVTKVYDGTAKMKSGANEYYEYDIATGVSGENDLKIKVTGDYNNAAAGQGKALTVAGVLQDGTNAKAANYKLPASAPANWTGTITKADLIINTPASRKVSAGTKLSDYSWDETVTGVNSEQVTGTFSMPVAGVESADPANSPYKNLAWTFTPTGAFANNYNVKNGTNGEIEVSSKTILANPAVSGKGAQVYKGSAVDAVELTTAGLTAPDYTVTYTGNGYNSATPPTDAGVYDVVVKLTDGKFSSHTFNSGQSYTITGGLTVSKAQLSPTFTVSNGTVGGTAATPSLTNIGALAPSDFTIEYKLTSAADSAYSETVPSSAGDYTARLTLKTAAAKNYEFAPAAVTTTTFKVSAASVAGTLAFDAVTYGTAVTPKTVAFNPDHSFAAGTDYEVQYKLGDAWGAAAPVNAGVYDAKIVLKGTAAANYTLTGGTAQVTISPKTLSWPAPQPSITKAYDGNAGFSVSVTPVGAVNSDTVAAVTLTGTVADANAGDAPKTVTFADPVQLTGNYRLPAKPADWTATITKKGITTATITGGGGTVGSVTAPAVDLGADVIAADGLALGVDYELVYMDSSSQTVDDILSAAAGTYTAKLQLKDTAKANNYSLASDVTASITISEIPAVEVRYTVAAADAVYNAAAYNADGKSVTVTFAESTAAIELKYEYAPVTYGEEDQVTVGQYADAAPITVGDYRVRVTPADASAYKASDDSVTEADFAITPLKLNAPTGLDKVNTEEGESIGKITNLGKDNQYGNKYLYEYRPVTEPASDWTAVEEGKTEITGLAAGKYEVRFQVPQVVVTPADPAVEGSVDVYGPDPNYDESESVQITISDQPEVTYTVHYNANGGKLSSDVPDDEDVELGTEITITGKATRSNYTFKGWRSSIDTKTYQAGDKITVTKDLTLTAQWKYNGGGGGSGGGGGGYIGPVADNSKSHSAYIKGYEDGTFRPENNISRAETATIFARVDDTFKEGNAYLAKFNDVPNAEWYYSYIGFTSSKGMVNGYEDGSFQPDGNITRAEFAAIAARSLNLANNGSASFADAKGHWAEGYIAQLVSKGIIAGYEDGSFRPDAQITRAEAVKVVNGVLGRKVTAAGLQNASYKTFSDVAESNWAYYEIIESANDHKYTASDGAENWK